MMTIPDAMGHKMKISIPVVSLLPQSYCPESPYRSPKLNRGWVFPLVSHWNWLLSPY